MERCTKTAVWLLISLLCCFFGTGWAADVQVSAQMNPPEFAQDETAAFIIAVSGTSAAEPEMPMVSGLSFRSQGQSQQSSWINGQFSASVSFTFAVQADKPGTYTIGPVKVTADGKPYMTQPVLCTVRPAQNPGSQPQPSAAEAANIGVLQLMPEKDRFYVGQLVPFTIKASFQPGKQINSVSEPRLANENFLLHNLDKKPIQQTEEVNGELRTSLIWRGVLSAVKEGDFPLAADLDAEVLVREKTRNGFGSPLFDDPFFEDFFNRYSRRTIRLASKAKPAAVLPLPLKNRPADFKGAIGTFSLAVAASPTTGGPGEPITLKMKITGSGNFDLVQAPELTDSKGWKIYPASGSLAAQGGGRGEKTFEQAVIPTSSSLKDIPSLHFSYFDPTAEEYVTLNSEPIPLHLQGNGASIPSPPAAGAASPMLPQKKNPSQHAPLPQPKHLEPPRAELGTMVQAIRPLYDKRWFQGMLAAAGCCLTAGLLLDLRRKRLEGNPDLVFRRQMERQLAEHYQEMQAAATAQDQEKFRRNCLEAVRKRAGVAWGRMPEAITLADLRERLAANSPLLGIVAQLEQSGYAGASLSQSEMEKILQTTRQELARLA